MGDLNQMQSLNKKQVSGTFELQNTLAPFTEDMKLVEIMKAVNEKLDTGEMFRPLFEIRIYNGRASIIIMKSNEEIGIVHMKINYQKRFYIPFKNPPKVGMSLQSFEKSFRPGVFNVSDECASKVVDWINEWKVLTKAKLKHYKFQPKIEDRILKIKVYKDHQDYDLFECPI